MTIYDLIYIAVALIVIIPTAATMIKFEIEDRKEN